ncbi:O-methyltransferase [Nannizzia gypsea CBS 118893]|uniref:O-methyltransferase n=1 Tax=Arthroderma gypseum (strain ATCC MYA-4604 / CBS 118893) TaxID=535722 RepID=E4V5C1_ARTGP|nr:O-methyltransferase [Nannizzia gypsea CBS 118893]EFR05195.1 O-methyltransferase [Nannizzia gypsea CBS 118893]
MDSATVLISKLQHLASRLSSEDDREARKECLQISKALTAQLEEPENVAVDMIFSPMVAVSARIAVDLNLFALIAKEEPVTSARLAELAGAEELLIIRILRPLSAIQFVEEVAPKTWKATRITKAMAIEGIAAGHRMISRFVVISMQSAPAYLKKHGYACPTDPNDGLMQYAFNSKKSAFERRLQYLHGQHNGCPEYWVDWYPVQSRIIDGASSDKALLVDVGAGRGHDLLAFKEKFPNTGKLVLEDLSAVTETLNDLDPAIEKVPYDFYTDQPVIGARAYFYHHILHDWSDVCCLKILEKVAAAMTPGYSKLLLHEMLVLDQGAPLFQAELDMTMMAFNGGMERTKDQWTALLEKAGLKVVQFWDPVDEGGDGIVEAMKA